MITKTSAFYKSPMFLLVGCGKSATASSCLGSSRGQSQKFSEILGIHEETEAEFNADSTRIQREFNAVECLDVLFDLLLNFADAKLRV